MNLWELRVREHGFQMMGNGNNGSPIWNGILGTRALKLMGNIFQ